MQQVSTKLESTKQESTPNILSEQSFHEFLVCFEAGIDRFVNGDVAAWKENASHHYDSTIMGAWGAYERGWDEVSARYEWAAARFMPNATKVRIEYLAVHVSGAMAYTIATEQSEPLIVGQANAAPMTLRVTHLFRLEEGGWKLLHRHADPLLDKSAPATVLQG
jgi:ketosteroid isomerase-like protein